RAFEDAFLSVQRQVIQVFRDQHLGQKSGRGDAFVDDLGWYGRLDQPFTPTADPFAPDMALDLEHSGGVVEFFADIFAEALKSTAATAVGVIGFVVDLTPGKVRWQR